MSGRKQPKKKPTRSGGEKLVRIVGDIRQGLQPEEFRIHEAMPTRKPKAVAAQPAAKTPARAKDARSQVSAMDPEALASIATTLWYLKTKFFRREWVDVEGFDDDPRSRRAMARIASAVDAMARLGVVVDDPVNRRFSAGSTNMRVIQMQPTAGLTFEKVVETTSPLVAIGEHLVQRAEVFVAVPMAESAPETIEPPQEPGRE